MNDYDKKLSKIHNNEIKSYTYENLFFCNVNTTSLLLCSIPYRYKLGFHNSELESQNYKLVSH